MNIIDQLRRDESEVLHAYQDSKGYWTIGVGTCIDQRVGCGITPEESAYLCQNRVDKATAELKQHLPWSANLDDARFGVLQNMLFNLGWAHLAGFHNTLSFIEQGNYMDAADEMLKSAWATEVGARATRLSQQMRTGQWI